jgi:protein phosphatase
MLNPGQGIRLRSSACTDAGKVRDNNEDRVDIWSNDRVVLAIVADGMGGAVAGEEASRIAIEKIHRGLTEDAAEPSEALELIDQETLAENMKSTIRVANEAIMRKAEVHPELKGMGTTITMALVRNTEVVLGHVGDSRAYLIDGDDGYIIQITADHSFVQALVNAGHISEEEAEDHPMKNVLYRALGQSHDVDVDVYFERLKVGDRLVLCSDGLTLHVKPKEIAQVVLAASSPAEASQKLVDLANERGGRDNVSVIVVKVESTEAETDVDDERAELGFYGDEDTLIIGEKGPFRSSESQMFPSLQDRDGNPSNRNQSGSPF